MARKGAWILLLDATCRDGNAGFYSKYFGCCASLAYGGCESEYPPDN
jgi:hypothetical protein